MPVQTEQIRRRRLRRRVVADDRATEPAAPALPVALPTTGSRLDRRSVTWWVFDTLLAGAAVLAVVSVVVEYRETHAEQPAPTIDVEVPARS